MKKHKTINVDVDGVLFPFVRELLETKFPEQVDTRVDKWEMWECLGISQEEWFEKFRHAVEHEALFLRGHPPYATSKILNRLSNDGFKIRIVTRRLVHSGLHKKAINHTVEWLDEHEIPYWDIVFMGSKSENKGDYPAEYAIDDNVEHYLQYLSRGTIAFLWDQPYNRILPVNNYRVNSWVELYEKIHRCESVLAEELNAYALLGGGVWEMVEDFTKPKSTHPYPPHLGLYDNSLLRDAVEPAVNLGEQLGFGE